MQMWVVGDEQNLHFKLLFDILGRLGNEWAKDLHHLSYGMVNLPSGRMKSREGTVVDADDLFDEMSDLAYQACRERLSEDSAVDETELRNRAEIIGLGALKFMLLKFNSKTTIMFDPAASIRFDGDTGAYVQYAAARIKSILGRAGEVVPGEADWSLLASPAEKRLGIELGFYAQTIADAARKLDCSVLVAYLLELAKSFNRFYRECPVLNAGDAALKQARLALISSVRDVLVDGLAALTIGVPAAM
jgi:arginyl-tRNA synthetase